MDTSAGWFVGVAPVLGGLVGVAVVIAARRLLDRYGRGVREAGVTLGDPAARGGGWWEISPPRVLPADGAAPVWRLIAAALAALPRGVRIVAELCADPDGAIHAGLWVPTINPDATRRARQRGHTVDHAVEHAAAHAVGVALVRAWPGAQLHPMSPSPSSGPITPATASSAAPGTALASVSRPRPGAPTEGIAGAAAVGAVEVIPDSGVWGPLVDHTRAATPARAGGVGRGEGPDTDSAEGEPLRAVLAGLIDAAARGEHARVQIIVSRAGRSGASAAPVGGLDITARLVSRGVLAVLDTLIPGPSRTRRPAAPGTRRSGTPGRASGGVLGGAAGTTGQAGSAAARAVEAKRAAGPHLRATVRLTATGPDPRRALWRARELAGGMAALALDPHLARLRPVPARRAARDVAHGRHGRPGSTFLATARELAAVWHLPAGGAAYGMAAPPPRYRHPDRALPRLSGHPTPNRTLDRGQHR